MPIRVAAVLSAFLAVGCFGPSLPSNVRCTDGFCPDGLVCDDGFCRRALSELDAAPLPDAAPDAARLCRSLRFETDIDDTTISEQAPNMSFGGSGRLGWDGMTDLGGEDFALVRFNGVFGNGSDQIPPGAEILAATLSLQIVNGGTGASGAIHESVATWVEDTTYNSFGPNPGVDAADIGDLLGDAPRQSAVGPVTVDVAPSAARGSVAGLMPSWILVPASGNPSGIEVASSESSGSAGPVLAIDYCEN